MSSFSIKSSHKFVNPRPDHDDKMSHEEVFDDGLIHNKPQSKGTTNGIVISATNTSVEDFY